MLKIIPFLICFLAQPFCAEYLYAETPEADKPSTYSLTTESSTFYYDSPHFINAIGYLPTGAIVSVCLKDDKFYRLCPFGTKGPYYLKPSVQLKASEGQGMPKLVKIFAFKGYIDLLYLDSTSPPAAYVDNYTANLSITFTPLQNRVEYIRYEKSWQHGDIRIFEEGSGAIRLEFDKAGQCGFEIVHSTPHALRIKFNECSKSNFLLAIDPGHGGQDRGACQEGICEADIALKTASMLKANLDKKGIRSFLIREQDTAVSLQDRLKNAVTGKASHFISLHYDKWEPSNYITEAPSGTACYFFHQYMSQMAKSICGKNSIKGIAVNNITQRGFYVLGSYVIPSVLVEIGNLANKSDFEIVSKPDFVKSAADFLAQEISSIYNNLGKNN